MSKYAILYKQRMQHPVTGAHFLLAKESFTVWVYVYWLDSCKNGLEMVSVLGSFAQIIRTNDELGIISYYLAPILNSVGITQAADQAGVNLGLQVWNFMLAATGAVASEKYGRRFLWLLGTIIMLLFLSGTTIVSGLFMELNITAAGLATVPMLFLFFSGFDIAYSPLFIAYPAEILPFQLRAKGLAVTLMTDAAACFFNQFVNPVAFSAIRWKYYLVYIGCLSFFLTMIYFFFPETKGRSLEEVAKIFDRDSKPTTTVKEIDSKSSKEYEKE